MITSLLEAGISEEQVAIRTGHCNTTSIRNYHKPSNALKRSHTRAILSSIDPGLQLSLRKSEKRKINEVYSDDSKSQDLPPNFHSENISMPTDLSQVSGIFNTHMNCFGWPDK